MERIYHRYGSERLWQIVCGGSPDFFDKLGFLRLTKEHGLESEFLKHRWDLCQSEFSLLTTKSRFGK